jgi:predicted RNase H-like nuclease (RuvC/YqgF family)
MVKQRQKIKTIRVDTVPNGYVLTVGKKQYMAFSQKELVEMIFVHVGLSIDDYMDKGMVRDLMTACAAAPDGVKQSEAIARQETVIKELGKNVNTLQVTNRWNQEQIKHKEEVNVKLRQELKQLKREHPKRIRKHQADIDELTQMEKDAKEKGLIK